MDLKVANIYDYGVGKFRVIDPHVNLKKHSKKINVDITNNFNFTDFQADALFLHASSFASNKIKSLIAELNKQKKFIIIDIDDYWVPNPEHPMFKFYIQQKNDKEIISFLKKANLVTTASKFLATELKKHVKNVEYIPNGIDENENQFQHKTKKKELFTFGWMGGSTHYEDLKLLRGVLSKLTKGGKSTEAQLVIGGFDDRIKKADGSFEHDFNKTIWRNVESMLTDNYSLLDDNYVSYLLSGNKIPHPSENQQIYKRVWSKSINTYGKIYNEIDVSLAPLKNNKFNNMKSALKIVEAGFHGLPIIASDIPLYSSYVPKDCGFLIKEKKSHKDWAKYINVLKTDEKMRKEMGGNLRKHCLNMFELTKLSKLREEIYLKYIY